MEGHGYVVTDTRLSLVDVALPAINLLADGMLNFIMVHRPPIVIFKIFLDVSTPSLTKSPEDPCSKSKFPRFLDFSFLYSELAPTAVIPLDRPHIPELSEQPTASVEEQNVYPTPAHPCQAQAHRRSSCNLPPYVTREATQLVGMSSDT
jgi:hypothetical protein